MTVTEDSRAELLAKADALEAEAVAHLRWERTEAAARCSEEADRLRAIADGAPAGPNPDAVDDLKTSVKGKLAEAQAHLQAAATIYAGLDMLVDQVLDTGLDIMGSVGDSEVAGAATAGFDAALAAEQAKVVDLEAQLDQARQDNAQLHADLEASAKTDTAEDTATVPFTFDIESSVDTLLEAVGDDPEKALVVLEAEYARDDADRSTLVKPLIAIGEAATKPDEA